MDYEIAVLGGGAAGLAASVMLENKRTVLCEKGSRVGKKLLATGSGTCNLSNLDMEKSHYHSKTGNAEAFVSPALQAFSVADTRAFFKQIGVETEADSRGRLYPVCRSAGAVLDCLRAASRAEEVTDFTVNEIRPSSGGYRVISSDGRIIEAKAVIAALGGAASPSLGGVKGGYRLLAAPGEDETPSVVPLKTDTRFTRALKGLRVEARVTLLFQNKAVCTASDELLFTENGLSGPAALAVSREVGLWEAEHRGSMSLQIDFLPSHNGEALLFERRLLNRPLIEWLTGLFHRRVGEMLVRASGLPAEKKSTELSEAEFMQLIKTVTAFPVTVLGTVGLREAQVTVGGLSLSQVNPLTMELCSRKHLYAVGEMLDIDGDCGGYNLQWAWSSAAVAARHAGASR